jgi:hypothetical protein
MTSDPATGSDPAPDAVSPESPAPEPTEEAAASRGRAWWGPRARTVLTGLTGILAIVGLLASVVGLWAKNVLLDSSNVAAAVENALDEPEVTRALATYITDETFRALDVDGRVEGLLPGPIQVLGPAITGGARAVVIDRVDQALSAEATRRTLVTVVERAHAATMRVLRGEPAIPGVRIEDDAVVVNLLPLIGTTIDLLPDIGIIERIGLPELDPADDAAEHLAQLEEFTGRDLPDDLGQLVVYRDESVREASASIAGARTALEVFERAVTIIVLVTIALLVVTVVAARHRRRAALLLGITSVAVVVLLRAALQRVIEEAPLTVLDPAARTAIRTSLVTLSSGLFAALSAVLLVGAITATWAFVTGPSESAAGIRRLAGTTGRSAGSVARTHPEGVAFAGVAAAVLTVLVGGWRLVTFVLAGLFLVGALWSWSRSGRGREEPVG